MRLKKTILLIALIMLMGTSNGLAGVNDSFGIGPKATALGQAYTAYADDFSAMHYNPAGLTQMKGLNLTVGLQVTDIDYEQTVNQKDFKYGADPLGGTTSANNSDLLYVPQIGLVYSPAGKRYAFGLGAYAPFGLHLWSDENSSNFRYSAAEVYNNRIIYAAPTFAYRIMDTLSLGLSVGMGYSEQGGFAQLRVPGIEDRLNPILSALYGPAATLPSGTGYATTLGSMDIDIDDTFNLSANLGVLWTPKDWLSLGITYRSESKSEMEGTTTFAYSQTTRQLIGSLGFPPPQAEETFDTSMDFRHPQSLSFGTKIDITERFRLMFDLVWTDWSSRTEEIYTYDGDPTFLALTAALGSGEPTDRLVIKRDWNDTWEPHVGIEYQTLDWLALRFGYHYRPSNIDKDTWDNMWPIIDYHIFSLGSGMVFEDRWTVDFAYSLLLGDDWDVKNGESRNLTADRILYSPYTGDEVEVETTVHNFMIAISYRF